MTTRSRPISRFLLVISAACALLAALAGGCGGASQQNTAGDTTPTPKPVTDDPGQGNAEEVDSFLIILSDPPTDVLLDGKPIGKTPIERIKVTPGAHDVTFVDEAEGNRTMGVTVEVGDTQTVKLDRIPKIREQK